MVTLYRRLMPAVSLPALLALRSFSEAGSFVEGVEAARGASVAGFTFANQDGLSSPDNDSVPSCPYISEVPLSC